MSELSRAARELRQRLDLDKLFGWDPPVDGKSAKGKSMEGKTAESPSAPAPGKAPPAAPPTRGAGRPQSADLEAPPPPDDGRRRESLLQPVAERVAACTLCPLSQTRTRTVFGEGSALARLMFVGEAPGYDEDQQGRPFVGKAGRLLDDIIKAMGLQRGQVFIANVLKCRPPGNRNPNPAEVGACHPYLQEQIRIVAPEVIVALGGVAAQFLLATDLSVGRLRGQFHDYGGTPLAVTYHPAYLLRKPEEKRKTWEDIQRVMERLGLRRG